ncbi:hypothetical protein CDG76_00530 [Nostoc sp. 'Peltigera membranacea cyanobiont' 210A]|nr:hypothetical protein CDG76_00530 [Nostoc sp. 'Peltigera membranacea cyanobiont' 210A]
MRWGLIPLNLGIQTKFSPEGNLQLGKTIFPNLKSRSGGYQNKEQAKLYNKNYDFVNENHDFGDDSLYIYGRRRSPS